MSDEKKPSPERIKEVTKQFMDEGRILEVGWAGHIFHVWFRGDSVPAFQAEQLRDAFFAGASHLFRSINGALEDGDEPTENDVRRIESIHQELIEFEEQYKQKHGIE